MHVADVVETYVRGRVRRGEIVALTARNHRVVLNQFAEVADCKVSKLQARHVKRWQERYEHLAQATKRNRLTIVRSFCRWMVDEHGIKDPCAKIRPLKEPRRLPRALDPEQVALILEACEDRRARLAAMLMVQEGLRRGEVARLEVGDFDLTNRLVRVVGKGGHQRVLHVTEQTRREVVGWLSESGVSAGPLLRSYQFPQRGLHPDTVSAMVRRAMEAAGVKRGPRDGVSPHALRHSALTDMLRAGAHIRDVQLVAGHAHLSTTETYMPLLVGTMADAMDGRWYGPAPLHAVG